MDQNRDQEASNISWSPLYTIENNWVEPAIIKRRNDNKAWKYGYDEKNDLVVISKDGTIGQIYNINGVRIALPKQPIGIDTTHNKWVAHTMHKDLQRIKNMHEWRNKDKEFKAKHVDYITREFNRREQGHWFANNRVPTYITGHHYMYLQHTKIDVGHPDFREANRILFIYWEACKADSRCFGMIYLKIRRSGFSFMGSSVSVDTATLARDARIGILSKTGNDAKKMFTDKVVPISHNYPFFFKPMQSGMDRPKTELAYSLPARKITKNNMHDSDVEEVDGLDTSIDWKNTDDNSYDGEKLLLMVSDEAGKWIKPLNIKNNWGVTKTCLRVGSKIIGKCFMGSTCNALAKGGQNFKDLYYDSDPSDRSQNGRTKSGLYKLFIPMEWNYEGFIDEYGFPVFEAPSKPVVGVDGELIHAGVIDYWNNEVEALKNSPDELNEHYRQFPRSEAHAFRDESTQSLFNLTKIYQQVDYNDTFIIPQKRVLTQGRFEWKGGEVGSEVIWQPDPRGRFLVSWLPDANRRNNVVIKNGLKHPGNADIGLFGCDPYDISGTVGGGGSKASLHGLTNFNMQGAPSNQFFLEYIARPNTAEEMFDDVIKAIHFYGMPILIENNKVRLLVHLKNNGYRPFSMNRPDKETSKLSKSELELGGIPNSSEDVKQTHANCIQTYIEEYVGIDNEGTYRESDVMGNMFFNRTLQDWARFDINNRTQHDASISSGLAIMASRKHKLVPQRQKTSITVSMPKYNNSGAHSRHHNN